MDRHVRQLLCERARLWLEPGGVRVAHPDVGLDLVEPGSQLGQPLAAWIAVCSSLSAFRQGPDLPAQLTFPLQQPRVGSRTELLARGGQLVEDGPRAGSLAHFKRLDVESAGRVSPVELHQQINGQLVALAHLGQEPRAQLEARRSFAELLGQLERPFDRRTSGLQVAGSTFEERQPVQRPGLRSQILALLEKGERPLVQAPRLVLLPQEVVHPGLQGDGITFHPLIRLAGDRDGILHDRTRLLNTVDVKQHDALSDQRQGEVPPLARPTRQVNALAHKAQRLIDLMQLEVSHSLGTDRQRLPFESVRQFAVETEGLFELLQSLFRVPHVQVDLPDVVEQSGLLLEIREILP